MPGFYEPIIFIAFLINVDYVWYMIRHGACVTLNADVNRPGTIREMKAQRASRYTPSYAESSYPFIPAIWEQYHDNNTGTSSHSLVSLANLITEMEIHCDTSIKQNIFFEDTGNARVLPRERSIIPTIEENVIRNSCRFQQPRAGNR